MSDETTTETTNETRAAKTSKTSKTSKAKTPKATALAKARAFYGGHKSYAAGEIRNLPPESTARYIDPRLPKTEVARLRAKYSAMGMDEIPADEVASGEANSIHVVGCEGAIVFVGPREIDDMRHETRLAHRARIFARFESAGATVGSLTEAELFARFQQRARAISI